jgi:predicted transcriptional regulator
LLKRGYVDARYKPEYSITEEELKALIDRVRKVKDVVERICKEKISLIH